MSDDRASSTPPPPPPGPPPLSGKKKLLFSLMALALVSVVTLGLAEIMLRVFSPQDMTGTWRVFGERGYLLNRSQGTARHQLGDRAVRYRFTAPHRRGAPARPGVPRVLVLGDSLTFGILLEEADTYVQLLQTFSDRDFGPDAYQFLNGAGGGWGTSEYLAYLEDFGDQIAPDLLIIYISSDDIGRSMRRKLYRVVDPETLELEALSLTHQHSGKKKLKRFLNALPIYQWSLEHCHLLQFARRLFLIRTGHLVNDVDLTDNRRTLGSVVVPGSWDLQVTAEEAVTLGHALFRRIIHWCRERNVPLLLTTTGWHFYALEITPEKLAEMETVEPTIAFMHRAPDLFAREGVPYHDITPEVLAATGGRPEEFIIPGDSHPDEEGSRLIALHSWAWLGEEIRKLREAPAVPAPALEAAAPPLESR